MNDNPYSELGLYQNEPAPMFFSSRQQPVEIAVEPEQPANEGNRRNMNWWDENDAEERAGTTARARFNVAEGTGIPRSNSRENARPSSTRPAQNAAASRNDRNLARTRSSTTVRRNNNNNNNNEPQVRRSRSQSTKSFTENPEEGIKQVPLINLEDPSPYLWTIGVGILITIILACEIIQSGGFKSISKNPMYGPDGSTMLQMGAKYGPLILDGEFWRLFSAILVQNGIIYYVVTIILLFFTRKIERDSGFWRTFIIFVLAGTYGYIVSSLFIPNYISCGATGSMFGYLGLMLCDLCASWRKVQKPVFRLIFLIVAIVVLLAVGLTPYVDNFVHVGGFIIGLLFALMLLPNLSFGKCERYCHGVIAFLAFPVMSVLFMVTLVVFFREVVDTNWCSWCHYINCVNISNWCPPN